MQWTRYGENGASPLNAGVGPTLAMRKLPIAVTILASGAGRPESAQHTAEAPLSGPSAPRSMATAKARKFRTVLRRAAAEGSNFNGHNKWPLVLALAIAAISPTATATEWRYLVPVDGEMSVLAEAPALQAYHVAAREALVGPPGRRAWEAIVFPSFQNEWAVFVEKGGSSGSQQVVCTRMQTQLWYQMESVAERVPASPYVERQLGALRKADKRVQRTTSPISASTAATLERLWSATLSQARLPAEPLMCIDGVSYLLFELSEHDRSRGGWSRCPRGGTPPAAGLEVLKALCGSTPDTTTLAAKIAQLERSLQ
jgi:hypothetical protein